MCVAISLPDRYSACTAAGTVSAGVAGFGQGNAWLRLAAAAPAVGGLEAGGQAGGQAGQCTVHPTLRSHIVGGGYGAAVALLQAAQDLLHNAKRLGGATVSDGVVPSDGDELRDLLQR